MCVRQQIRLREQAREYIAKMRAEGYSDIYIDACYLARNSRVSVGVFSDLLEEKQDDNPYIFNPEDASDAYREPTDYTKFLKKEEKTL